jgi:hypothetical protein
MSLRDEILARADLSDLVASRADDGAIAAAMSVDRPMQATDVRMTDMNLVAAILAKTGDLKMSDSILSKFDQLSAGSRSMHAVLARFQADGVNIADPSFRAQLKALTPSVFTEAERDMLLSLSIVQTPVSVADVIAALAGQGELK